MATKSLQRMQNKYKPGDRVWVSLGGFKPRLAKVDTVEHATVRVVFADSKMTQRVRLKDVAPEDEKPVESNLLKPPSLQNLVHIPGKRQESLTIVQPLTPVKKEVPPVDSHRFAQTGVGQSAADGGVHQRLTAWLRWAQEEAGASRGKFAPLLGLTEGRLGQILLGNTLADDEELISIASYAETRFHNGVNWLESLEYSRNQDQAAGVRFRVRKQKPRVKREPVEVVMDAQKFPVPAVVVQPEPAPKPVAPLPQKQVTVKVNGREITGTSEDLRNLLGLG